MPPTVAQRKWVEDALQVIKLSDHEEIEEGHRQEALKGEIEKGRQKIDQKVKANSQAVRLFFAAYRQGLLDFGNAMLDTEEMDEKEATSAADIVFKIFLGVAAAAFPEEALAAALGKKLAERVGEVGVDLGKKAAASIKEFTKDALEKGRDHVKGNPKPNVRAFREFTKALGDNSINDEAVMTTAVEQGGESVKDAFSQMATAAGTTDGLAGEFLTIMASASATFTKWLQSQTDANKLEEKFATEFAGRAGQTPKRGSALDTTRDTGTLYFEITTVTSMYSDNPSFSLGDDTDDAWKLVMLGNKKDAQGAARALKESVHQPWKIDMPRKVRIDVYNERNKRDARMCGGWLVFNKGNTGMTPDKLEGVVGSYAGWDTRKRPEEWLTLAWNNKTVSNAATQNTELEGAVD
jgi:hypothetical protein